ncbi:MAG: carboxypeptidase regulatory-like domain-containing protein [Thermoanaerobaculia bacterium]
MRRYLFILLAVGVLCVPAFAQETGTVSGTITMDDGTDLPGVTVTASGDVLPQPRIVVSEGTGLYRFPFLPPGNYELTFEMDGMATQKYSLEVLLEKNTVVNVTMTTAAVEDVIEVVAATETLDLTTPTIQSAISDRTIEALPVGQEFRDFLKLAPGVQYTEDSIRGPSAGGSGQDNVYKIDGVDVGLPLFGSLTTEPASYDIEQVSFIRGGVKAVDFNRSGGLTVNSVTRSGTNAWRGLVNYQIQSASMTGDVTDESDETFDEDKDWLTLGIGGPLWKDKAFFYGSYYRPTESQTSKANVYGEVPDFDETRDEFFGKLTFTPTASLLLSGSYRDSQTDSQGRSVCDTCAGTTSVGDDSSQQVGYLEGTWLINDRMSLNAKYTDWANEGTTTPDNLLNLDIGPGRNLNVAALDTQGLFNVPTFLDGLPDFNAWADPIIQQYGYIENGVRMGGGEVGVDDTIDGIDFYRQDFSIGFDYFLDRHQLHFGYQMYDISEELLRVSNGWGAITATGGRDTAAPDVFYEARIWQQSLADTVPKIVSSMESQGLELNDTFTLKDWTFNVGVLFSEDTYFGSGLNYTGQGLSGFENSPGTKYEMYNIGFGDMIQPRLGATWSWNGRDKAYASYARYNPAASSLPRAASWDRNLQRQIDIQFDNDGNYLSTDPVRSSSGKWFDDGLDPRYIDEFLIGYDRQVTNRLVARTHFRFREGKNFWEDTANDDRVILEPPAGIPRELYIPYLDDIRAEIGGSSYVIAQLDDAFTEYYEVVLEAEYRSAKWYAQAGYTWSQYYGNFDQDNSTTSNDQNIFIGSSFIADWAGRQLWNNRYGYLRGDRRNQFKAYGYYNLPWNATAGGFFVYQDGQPWEAWDYRAIASQYTGSTSDTSRYAEPAGSRRTDNHYQLDLNYTQYFNFGSRYRIRLTADLFNLFDSQTGYNIQNKVNSANFGVPRDWFDPRRLQLSGGFEF